jgi:hypothetical protein
MKDMNDRIRCAGLEEKITAAEDAALLIEDGMATV